MISRVRMEAKGSTQEEVISSLDYATSRLFASQDATVIGDSCFEQEVVESDIQDNGAIHYKGRRVIRFEGLSVGPPLPPTMQVEWKT